MTTKWGRQASGSGFSRTLKSAALAGFDAALWRGDWLLLGANAADFADAVSAGEAVCLRTMIDIDVSRFPLDHPLVAERPELFAIRRSKQHDGPIDPRRPMPPIGEAIARFNHPGAVGILGKPITQRLEALAAAGIGGFRFLNAARLGGKTLSFMTSALKGRDVMMIAASGGAGAEDPSGTGLDCLVAPLAWSDLIASSMPIHFGGTEQGLPVLVELGSDQHNFQDVGGTFARLFHAAAALADGLIVPEAFVASGPDAVKAAQQAISLAQQAASYDGAVQCLARTTGNVMTFARTRKADPRAVRGALVVVINGGPETQPSPASGAIIQRTGTPLDVSESDLSPLAPGEVRLIELKPAKPIIVASASDSEPAAAARFIVAPRLVVESVSPSVEGGDFAVKRVVGDAVPVSAAIFADGHEQLAAELRWRSRDGDEWTSTPMLALGKNDLWTGNFTLERLGAYEFVIEAWLDRFGGFRRDFVKKLDAGVAQPVDHADGRALIEQAATLVTGTSADKLRDWLDRLADPASAEESAAILLDEELAALMEAVDDRPFSMVTDPQRVDAERLAARFSSWYELFPRSMTDDKSRHGTFSDVIPHLARIRDMGFDTLYFPPIHPIGKTNRKGPNNTLTPEPHDVGSPYAIGSAEGGHDAIHPELGGFEDFDRLVGAARDHGLEIALDFAIQASPDHPWLKEHPGWFSWRSDGSMKYAENPPKKYQDIVNLDFYGPDSVPKLWLALRDVVLLWIEHGVTTFRVDNPHTKPLPFWEWMIADIRNEHPEAIFLAEAFTRPTMMYRLAKVGFSQSYTYFTWRDGKHELIDYVTELTTTEPKEFYRPHFFVNTPDINPMFLQTSGRPGFQIRAVLAATLSGLFGVYSGFELCESAALPGREEYLDSEKYEIRPRDLAAPGNIIADITLLNRLRRAHPALQTHLNTKFYLAHNDNMIWYGKPSPDGDEMVMVMVNLDPHHAQETHFEVPLWEFGLSDTASIAVEDLALGQSFEWHGKTQWIRITPDLPYRIWRLNAPEGTA